MTALVRVPDQFLTVRDGRGASLVLERADGVVSAWIAPPGGNDGPSVFLDGESLRQIAAFVGLPRGAS